MRQKQMKFEMSRLRSELRFGRSLLKKAKNRTAQPVSSRDPMHLVLRSTKAKGVLSFGYKTNVAKVKRIVDRHCDKYGVRLIEYSNNFNHLHLLLKFASRATYLRFIRSLTGSIALAVSGASKLKSLKEFFGAKGFWDFRPFTLVVRSFRGYKVARDYVILNQLEAAEILPKRAGRLRDVTRGELFWFSG